MLSVRTIFILIRGEYMAGAALRIAKKDVESLTKAEIQNIRVSQQMAHYALFAGGAMLIFGGMVARALVQIMDKYGETSMVMQQFHHEMDEGMAKFAHSLINVLGPTLLWLAKLFNKIAGHPILAWFVGLGAIALVVVGGLGLLAGSVLQLIQFFGLVTGKIGLATLATRLFGHSTGMASGKVTAYMTVLEGMDIQTKKNILSTIGLTTAVSSLLSGFIIAFTIVDTIGRLFGRLPAIIAGVTIAVLGLAVAIVALRAAAGDITGLVLFGASLAAGGAIMAGYAATLANYQKGTSFVRKGGLAILHGGEEIKSAREMTATPLIERQRRGEIGAGGVPTTTNMWRIPITIEHVHTKAEYEDLDEQLSEAMRKAGRRAR